MPASTRFFRNTFAVAAILFAAAAVARDTPTSTDEARSWSQLHQMKAMEVMHAMDAGKKGYVTREEFMSFQERFFDRMDRNHDGKVDAQEWMGDKK